MSALSVRIPEELTSSLEKACEVTERSKGYIVRKALEQYLEDLQDHLIAEQAYKDYVKSDKKSADLKVVAKKAGVSLKNYK
jgi:RHH-type rel operon transcriptional repressor/antitoxin RelB